MPQIPIVLLGSPDAWSDRPMRKRTGEHGDRCALRRGRGRRGLPGDEGVDGPAIGADVDTARRRGESIGASINLGAPADLALLLVDDHDLAVAPADEVVADHDQGVGVGGLRGPEETAFLLATVFVKLLADVEQALTQLLDLRLVLGLLLGGISGYTGGWVDVLIQRLIEFIRSMPTIPLWLALGAAVPVDWSVVKTYFAIVVIISFIGWTGLARQVRGRFLSMRDEDFVIAARLYGTGRLTIIFRHMLPSFMSHIIATTTLAIPAIIIAETSLSFLGLGLRPPVMSWGVLLKEAQNLQSVSQAPWLLLPAVVVIVAILAFNFMGDGLRDAADPYSTH